MNRRAAMVPALLVALAAGCGGQERRGTTTLRFWAMGREGEVVQELLRDFETENPGIRVRMQQIPWTAAHEKLLTGFVGREMPDVAQMGNTWIPEMSALDAIEPLARQAGGVYSMRPVQLPPSPPQR